MTGSAGNRRELQRTDLYSEKRAILTASQLAALREAEDEIAEDPMHVFWRRPTTDGATLDYMAADSGLMVVYRVVSATQVVLEDLIDLSLGR